MKVTVNKDACIGCGACSQICPVFGFNDAEGHATVAAPEEIEANKATVIEAQESCPTSAIIVEEDKK